jgi:hypothetical protein
MNKWSNDYCKLLKGGCGNVLYTLKWTYVVSLSLV